MASEIKQSKRGGKRNGAGRKRKPRADENGGWVKIPGDAPTEDVVAIATAEDPEAEARARGYIQEAATVVAGPTVQEAPKIGRPSEFTAEIGHVICERLAMGQTLTKICAMADMPSRTTEWRWRESSDEYRNAVARAREERAHAWAEAVVDITDDVKAEAAEVNKARLQVDARLKIMARHNPKQYGERLGVDLNTPLETMTEEQLIDRARKQAAALGIGVALN